MVTTGWSIWRHLFVAALAANVLACGTSPSGAPGDGGAPADPDGSTREVNEPPMLRVDSPDRASWSTDPSVTVAGVASDDQPDLTVTINGEVVATEPSGEFSESVATGPGIQVLATEAEDTAGNSVRDIRAVLAGGFLPYGDPTPDGIAVRLGEGPGGLGALEALGASLVEEEDLGALIPNPVFQDSSEACVLGICVTLYAVTVNVSNPRFDEVDLLIDPGEDGTVFLRVTVSNPRFDWSASGTIAEVDSSGSGEIRASSVTVSTTVTPSVGPDGDIEVEGTAGDASINGFVWNMEGFLGDVLDFFGADALVEDIVSNAMVDAIEDAVRDQTPALLEGTLNDLALSEELPIGDRTYSLKATPRRIEVDDAGITLGLACEAVVDETAHTGELGLGSLYAAYAPPSWKLDSGMHIGVSTDFLNQFLLALWRGGLFDIEAPAAALGLPEEAIMLVAPAAQSPVLATHAGLPPVLVPREGADGYTLQLGDYRLALHEGTVGEETQRLEAWVSILADLDVTVTPDGVLGVDLSNPTVAVDVTQLSDPEGDPEQLETLFEALLPQLLAGLEDALEGVPLPSIAGFGLDEPSVDDSGDHQGFLVVHGTLTAVE